MNLVLKICAKILLLEGMKVSLYRYYYKLYRIRLNLLILFINMKKVLRLLLIAFYAFAGSYHFISPDFYSGLIPDYLPFHTFINYASGVLEIILAIGVALPKYRSAAGKGIVLLLILFIPSHIYFIQIGSCVEDGLCVAPWIAWIRLLIIHPLLMLWAWSVVPFKNN